MTELQTESVDIHEESSRHQVLVLPDEADRGHLFRDVSAQDDISAVITIISLQSDDLNVQCKTCFENLRSCVRAASAASNVKYTFTQTKLGPIQDRLDEHRLRLDIWMSDCGIADGNLSIITLDTEATLFNGLATLFKRVQGSLENIFKGICDLERDAKQCVGDVKRQRYFDDIYNGATADRLRRPLIPKINETEERIMLEYDHLAQSLHELAKLQHSVQMASAIHLGRGPEAALSLGIKNFQNTLRSREGDSESEEISLLAVTEDNASHKSGDERCTACEKWFPWYTIPLHADTCTAGTEICHGPGKIAPEAGTSADTGIAPDTEVGDISKALTTDGTVLDSVISTTNMPTRNSTASSLPAIEPGNRSQHSTSVLGFEMSELDSPSNPRRHNRSADLSENQSRNHLLSNVLDYAHIFAICIGATAGIGFARMSGEIIAIAGPGGTLIAFIVVGVVVICVMEGICEMICRWPMSGGIIKFVEVFVDPDLAVVVGFTYWYSYCCAIAALIIGIGDLLRYFDISRTLLVVIYVACMVIIFLINCFPVLFFGWIQFWGGFLKLLILGGIFALMITINAGVNTDHRNGEIPFSDGFRNNPNVASTRAVAVLIAVPLAVFAFIGVESITATASEAKRPKDLHRPAKNIAYVMLIIYGIIIGSVSANVEWFDRNLPQLYSQDLVSTESIDIGILGHIPLTNQTSPLLGTHFAPIIATLEAGSLYKTTAIVLLVCLVLSALNCANASLYIASRTLHSLAADLDFNHNSWLQKLCAHLRKVTPVTRVPLFSLIVSLLCLSWIPLVDIGRMQQDLFQIIASIASVGILLVWASQCLAFIRYRKWIWMHKDEFASIYSEYNLWPLELEFSSYATALQPLPAYIGFVSCLVIAFGMSSAGMWNGNYLLLKGFSLYSGPAISLFLFVILKLVHRRGWVKLSPDFSDLRRELQLLDFLSKKY